VVEIVTTDDQSGADLVEVAFAGNPAEAKMVQGLLKGGGIPSLLQPIGMSRSRRVMVRASGAEKARALLAETLVEDEEAAWPEIANAKHLEDTGGRPRGYGLAGAYARIWLWSLGAIGVALGVFLLVRS
jgi:Putative prokaryotic signal transducing protein